MSGTVCLEDIINIQQIQERYANTDDPQLRWNLVQLKAALLLIRHFLGRRWYRLVIERFGDPDTMSSREYQKLLRTRKPQPHPLAEAFWSGQPEEFTRVLGLGAALRVLGCEKETNLSAKIGELRSESFAHVYFELKMACRYALGGYEVQFLRPTSGVKTPDFSLAKYGLRAMAECKKRSAASEAPLDTRVAGVLDRLREAHAQIAASATHGVACIEVEDDLDFTSDPVEAYTKAVQQELPLRPEVTCVLLTWEKILALQGGALSLATAFCGIPNQHLFSLHFSGIPAEALCNFKSAEQYCVIPNMENAPRTALKDDTRGSVL